MQVVKATNEEIEIIQTLLSDNLSLKQQVKTLEKQLEDQQIFYADLCSNQGISCRIKLYFKRKVLGIIGR